jgi:hypothetical protein
MVAVPTLAEEDAKRPSRERETLVGEATENKDVTVPFLQGLKETGRVEPIGLRSPMFARQSSRRSSGSVSVASTRSSRRRPRA